MHDAMDWIMFSQNSYGEALTLNMTEIRKWVKLNEVIRVEPWSYRISVIKETPERMFAHFLQ